MHLRIAGLIVASALLTGCSCLDDYPHNDEQTTPSDVIKTGGGSYGGFNSNVPVILSNGDTSTRSATTTAE